jgi:hypothetical protein
MSRRFEQLQRLAEAQSLVLETVEGRGGIRYAVKRPEGNGLYAGRPFETLDEVEQHLTV